MRHRHAAVIAALTFAVATVAVPPPAAHGATASVPSDFNGDGYSDLAVGVPGQDLGDLRNAGQVNVIYGSATGLTAARDQVWTQASRASRAWPKVGKDRREIVFLATHSAGNLPRAISMATASPIWRSHRPTTGRTAARLARSTSSMADRRASTRVATNCSHQQTCRAASAT